MKIAIFDTNMFKFTSDMYRTWREVGREVTRFHTLRLPDLEAADVAWFDCVDNSLVVATQNHPGLLAGKIVVARCIDLDAWAGHYRGVDWRHVDHLVFIAPHIMKLVLGDLGDRLPAHVGVHLVPCGVDLERFTMRADPCSNRDVAVVTKLWHGKGLDLLLQVIAAAPEFTFHICGEWGLNGIEGGWYRAYVDQFLSHCRNWTHVGRVDDMNAWLEDKAFALVCSKKETFSYAAAESAAKGLRPLVHDFYGAAVIWPDGWRWRTIGECAAALRDGRYEPDEYRQFVADKYPLKKMMERLDAVIALGETKDGK